MKTSLLILTGLCLTLLPGCIKEIKEVRLDGQQPDVRDIHNAQPSECSQALAVNGD